MVDTINPALGVAPQAFHGVDVGGPVDVLLGSVLDGLMGVAELAEPTVGAEFVGVDDCARSGGDMLLDDGEQGLGLHVGRDLGESLAATLYQALVGERLERLRRGEVAQAERRLEESLRAGVAR